MIMHYFVLIGMENISRLERMNGLLNNIQEGRKMT